MKLKISYKEFSLIIGILVALIIVLTIWISNEAKLSSTRSIMPTVPLQGTTLAFIEKAFSKIN